MTEGQSQVDDGEEVKDEATQSLTVRSVGIRNVLRRKKRKDRTREVELRSSTEII